MWLTYKIIKNGSLGRGCTTYVYVFIVVSAIMGFTIGVSSFVIQDIYKKTTTIYNGERYIGEVISYESYDSYDSDTGNTTVMYTPVIAFTTHNGQEIEYQLSYSSSSEPYKGQLYKIYYDEAAQTTVEVGFGAFSMLFILILFQTILVGVFIGVVMFAMGRDMRGYKRVVSYVGLNIIIPIIMIAFSLLLIYVLFNGDDKPLWVSFVCGLFAFFLILGTIGYFKGVVGKNVKWVQTGHNSWSAIVEEDEEEQHIIDSKDNNDLIHKKKNKYKQKTSRYDD
ncbi:DUF3592 domain-containing protein [Myroides injenensis]|uniref:DUF3592 domain-containing protein n=1 Tax=Myroides injenensis TaxID=1183151 RepID=UPI00047535A8|nr:DUF3592 domain-containing protein [Myroides injenensis]